MKNKVSYHQVKISGNKKGNIVDPEKLLFLLKKQETKKSPVFNANRIDSELVSTVKAYLNQDELRGLVRDSFGNEKKRSALLETIKSFVSRKEVLNDFPDVTNEYSLTEISEYITEEIAGLSVLKNIINPSTTDIKIYDWNNIWVDDYKAGFYKTEVSFDSPEDYKALCQRFVNASGENWTKSKPIVKAVFPQMRVNIVGYDISRKISTSIRIISKEVRLTKELIESSGYATFEMMEFLKVCMLTKTPIVVTGETGTGKTELIRYLTQYITDKALIMIEDTPETYLDEIYQAPINMWQTREPDEEGKNGIDYSVLIEEALRHNPDWIMIQESRGKEGYYILVSAETGHGMATTLHAKSAIHAVSRMITLCQQNVYEKAEYYGKRFTEYIKIGVHLKRINGVRKIVQIVEYVDFQDNKPVVNVLYEYDEVQGKHMKKDSMSAELWEHIISSDGVSNEEMMELQPVLLNV